MLSSLACARITLSREVRLAKRTPHEGDRHLRFCNGDVRGGPPLCLSNSPIRSGLHTFEYVTHIRQQVFSGSFPFEGNRNEAVILLVKSGEHPRRPESGFDHGLTDELWKMMKGCWKQARDRRWNISRIVSVLKRHSSAAAVATTE